MIIMMSCPYNEEDQFCTELEVTRFHWLMNSKSAKLYIIKQLERIYLTRGFIKFWIVFVIISILGDPRLNKKTAYPDLDFIEIFQFIGFSFLCLYLLPMFFRSFVPDRPDDHVAFYEYIDFVVLLYLPFVINYPILLSTTIMYSIIAYWTSYIDYQYMVHEGCFPREAVEPELCCYCGGDIPTDQLVNWHCDHHKDVKIHKLCFDDYDDVYNCPKCI
jgi:hypothetical protein